MAEIARIERHFGGNFKNTAATGVAASQLERGSTAHTAFGIPLEGLDKPARALSAEAVVKLRLKFSSVTSFSLDEISFCTPEMGYRVHFNLSQAFPHVGSGEFATPQTRPFGGKNAVWSGDFFQLPPPVGTSFTTALNLLTARAQGRAP
jgi:hypothetical protein